MILLTLSRGNEHERVHLRLPASPAEIGEAFVILDGISLDTTTTAILDVRGNVPGLYRYGWAMFEGLQATMAERVTSILASDNMFMERIQENMEFTLLPTYRIWLEYVFRGKGVDREEAASFAAGCIKRLAEPLLDAGYGIEKILCYREEFDWP